jgi:predicted RNA-binding protein with PIN domain/cell division septum initiation protein DivIVA
VTEPQIPDPERDDEPAAAPVLPGPVRDRVLAAAADTLGALPADEVPARLRAVARFAPAKRARLGGTALAAALDSDSFFAARVAEVARGADPEIVAALERGSAPSAADPVELAALAYLVRIPEWPRWVARASEALDKDSGAGRRSEQEVARLRDQLEAARAQGRASVEAERQKTADLRAELAAMRRSVADARRATAAAEARAGEARAASDAAVADVDRRAANAERETRRLRDRLAEVDAALDGARRAARAGRAADDARLRLLVDTLVEAAAGLRRELALPPLAAGDRPADAVAATLGESGPGTGTESARPRALATDDPATLDQLLALPHVHLVVDGYNVTMTGYGSLPLETQRARLLGGLAGLAARTSAEVTCVFDGAALDHATPTGAPRGVRVMFSPAGVTADSVIRRLVRAEPAGRAVVVVSSDQEVIDGVVAAGARAVAAVALVRRLDRG